MMYCKKNLRQKLELLAEKAETKRSINETSDIASEIAVFKMDMKRFRNEIHKAKRRGERPLYVALPSDEKGQSVIFVVNLMGGRLSSTSASSI